MLQVDNHRGKITKHGIKLNGYSYLKLRYAASYTKYYSLGFTYKNGRPSPRDGFVFNGSYFSD